MAVKTPEGKHLLSPAELGIEDPTLPLDVVVAIMALRQSYQRNEQLVKTLNRELAQRAAAKLNNGYKK